jgi:hypothetical protein
MQEASFRTHEKNHSRLSSGMNSGVQQGSTSVPQATRPDKGKRSTLKTDLNALLE